MPTKFLDTYFLIVKFWIVHTSVIYVTPCVWITVVITEHTLCLCISRRFTRAVLKLVCISQRNKDKSPMKRTSNYLSHKKGSEYSFVAIVAVTKLRARMRQAAVEIRTFRTLGDGYR